MYEKVATFMYINDIGNEKGPSIITSRGNAIVAWTQDSKGWKSRFRPLTTSTYDVKGSDLYS